MGGMSMGLYIKNMKTPESCLYCAFNYDRFKCLITKENTIGLDYDKRHCPLIPVPPHGDLIDRDEMRETIKPWTPEDEITGCTFDIVKKLMHTMISRAPVIIPAEPQKEE